jgi:hypothetical protein
MRVKSMKRPGVLGALLTLLSPKGSLHIRRLIVALLTPPDLLATRQVGADSAQRPAWPTADSERRLMKKEESFGPSGEARTLTLGESRPTERSRRWGRGDRTGCPRSACVTVPKHPVKEVKMTTNFPP